VSPFEGKRVVLVFGTTLVVLIALISGAFLLVKSELPVQQKNMAELASLDHAEILVYQIASQILATRHTSNKKTYQKRIGSLEGLISSLEKEYHQIQRIKTRAGKTTSFRSSAKVQPEDVFLTLRDQLEEFILKSKNFRSLPYQQHSEQQDSLVTVISRLSAGNLARVFTQARIIFQRSIDAEITRLSWIFTLLWGGIVGGIMVVSMLVFRIPIKKVIRINEILRTEQNLLQDEKQELQQQLQEQETTVHQYEHILDVLPDGLLMVFKDDTLKMSQPFIKLLKVPDALANNRDYDEIRHFLMLSFIKGEDFGRHFQELNKHVNDNRYFTLSHKDGRQMECQTEPILLQENVIGRVWIFREKSGKPNSKHTHQKTESLSSAKFDPTPPGGMASIFHELNGTILEADINAFQLFGFAREEFLGRNIKSLFPEETLMEMKQHYREISKWGHYHFETRFIRQNGKIFSARVAANIIKPNHSRMIHLLIEFLQFHPNGQKNTVYQPEEKNLTLEPSS